MSIFSIKKMSWSLFKLCFLSIICEKTVQFSIVKPMTLFVLCSSSGEGKSLILRSKFSYVA